MAPIPLIKPSSKVRDVKHYGREMKRRKSPIINEDVPKDNDNHPSTIDNKIEFFRFMGLEMKKVCEVDFIANSNNNDNSDDNNNEFCYSKSSVSQSCKLSDNKASSISDIPDDKFTLKSVRKRQTNKETTSQSRSMINYKMIVESMRECCVMIIGEKCRICGKSFKCIKDLESHTSKKHKRKKPRRKVVLLKIGDEVISRVPIRRKHLKRVYRDDDCAKINGDNAITRETWKGEEETRRIITHNDRLNDEKLTIPLIDIDDACDIADVESNSARITGCDVLLSPLGATDADPSKANFKDNDDEDIKEVLRITRSTNGRTAINHETPNRIERELLLSEAILELERLNKNMIDTMDIIEFDDNDKAINDKDNDYCWKDERNSQSPRYDVAEDNCFYDVRSNCKLDFSLGDGNSLAGVYNEQYFNDDDSCQDYKGYRNENGEIVPYYIDYTQCLDNNHVLLNNNNNNNNNNDASNGKNVYELGASFYNEARIDKWKELAKIKSTFNCAIR